MSEPKELKLPDAAIVVGEALSRCHISGKNVAIYFHASWCPWCVKFEHLWTQSALAAPLKDAYEFVLLNVRDRSPEQNHEHPGWRQLMQEYRGSSALDVPFLAILNADGLVIAKSYEPANGNIPSNAGYPVTETELDQFIDLIASTATDFPSEYLQVLRLLLERPSI